MRRITAWLMIALTLIASPALAQNVRVYDPATGLPVFSTANPAPVTVSATTGAALDVTSSGTISGVSQSVTLNLNSKSGASIQITGTWVGTLQFEGTVDGTTFTPINGVYAGASTPTPTITINGIVRLTPAGLTQFRITSTAWTSGTATISMRASAGSGGTFLNQSLTAGTNTIGTVMIGPAPGTGIRGASGNVANAAATATLTGTAATTVYITGFTCNPGGATAATLVSVTITGTLGGTYTYTAGAPSGSTSVGAPVTGAFIPAQAASAVNTPIVVSMPALGIGNTNATCVATGFHL